MLFQRNLGKPQGRGREVIGLIGTHHGVGVTHTALMLAFYMGEELCKKTALLECNRHRDLRLIQESYQWEGEDANTFSFHRITCFKEVNVSQISDIFGDDYESIIMDFGEDFEACKEEFLRCSIKIVIGGRSEWDRTKLKQFVNATDSLRGSSTWLYFIPQADDRIAIKVSSEIKRKAYVVPVMAEPTMPSKVSSKFFGRII